MDQKLPGGFPDGAWTLELIRHALAEDIGAGDATTAVTITGDATGKADIRARQSGVLAGLPVLSLLFAELDPAVRVRCLLADGDRVVPDQVVAELTGPLATLLTGERAALNFLQHLGGIATLTDRFVQQTLGTACRVLDTRKTLPGWRHLAKYAVRCGGGQNHRMGLYDRIMLKDNHWASGAGQIAALVARARQQFPQLAVEVEVDDLQQLAAVLPLAVEWILLDNFTPDEAVQGVVARDRAGSATLLEASGNIDLTTIGAFAAAGVDAASVGRLTHSAPALDLGMDLR